MGSAVPIGAEAGHALIDISRTLRLWQCEASHFIDNPASARMLDKLGFESAGIIAWWSNCARGEEVPAPLMRRVHAAAAEQKEAPAA